MNLTARRRRAALHRTPPSRRDRFVALTVGIGLIAGVSAVPLVAVGVARGEPRAVPEARTLERRAAPSGDAWPITACGTYSGKGCAPTSARIDLTKPTFSNPTKITNPLFPLNGTKAVIQLGQVEGKPFRSETTRLPETGTVEWEGKKIEVVLSQYLAFRDGRIEEIALDRYAQADDGSVWYLGEDVFDYTGGTISQSGGTWLVGRDGPPAMIMPATPKVGDVFRVENILGVVFEEIKVTKVGLTVQGPTGPISGAIEVDELRLDGTYSHKSFAPGFGEFRTVDGADVEALAVAAADARDQSSLPDDLRLLTTSAWGVLENTRAADWEGARTTVNRMTAAWKRVHASGQPPLVSARLDAALASLVRAVRAEQAPRAAQSSIDLAQASLDLWLRHVPVLRVDIERAHQHGQQLRVHAAAKDAGGVLGEVAALEWTIERIALDGPQRAEIGQLLRDLRGAADARNLPGAADHAARLAARLRSLA